MRRDRFVSASMFVAAVSLFPPVNAWALPQAPAGGAQPPAAGPGTAAAPEIKAAPAVEGEEKTADQYALEGRDLAQRGDLAGAYRAMLIAWDLKKSYDIAGNLGVVELQLGKPRDAAEHLLFCKTNYPAVRDEAMSQKLTKLEELLATARKDIGSVRIDVAAKDDADSDGAEVYVGDRLVGRSPIETEVFVDPGSYSIRVRLPGFGEQKQSVNVAKGATVGVKFVLVPAEAGPVSGEPLPKNKVIIGVGLGLVAAGLGAGIGFTLAANSKSASAEETIARNFNGNRSACYDTNAQLECANVKSTVKTLDTFTNVAVVGFAVGGAAALGVVTYLLLPSSNVPRKTGARISPWVSAEGGGVLLSSAM